MEFKGKVVLVTGATSGMGWAFVHAFAHQGAAVMATGRSASRARALVESVADLDARIVSCLGDVGEPAFCEHAIDETSRKLGPLDILVNNAGIIHRGDALATSPEEWRAIMAANLDGVFFMSRAALKVMKPARRGVIVNVGSTVGLVACDGLTAYCASKGAVVNLTKAMALDHARDNIRVNAVCPGAVDTPMLISGYEGRGLTPSDIHARNLVQIPQNRIPSADEIAEAVLFLASDRARHITGAALPVDGGYTAQ